MHTEPLYLVHAGGDAYQASIVPESQLDKAYLLTQWHALDPADIEWHDEALAHFHDEDAWEHAEVTGKGPRVRFYQNFEDGWVEVVRLPDAQTAAARDVLAERQRQIDVEGWTPEHDDEHKGGSMAIAAACFALAGAQSDRVSSEFVAKIWPWTGWAWQWWKPKDRRHNLVRSAALILAEIERRDRADTASRHAAAAPWIA